MDVTQAHEETKRLFAAFGTMKPPEVLSEFARVLLHASCETCALETVAELRDSGHKAPSSVMALRTSIIERMGTQAHMPHLSETTKESAAGRAEAFWHRAASIVEVELKCSKLSSGRVAARMWCSGAVDADETAVAVECQDAGIWAFEASLPVSNELVAHFWSMARRNAVNPVIRWPEAEWDEASRTETRLLSEASA